MPTYEYECGNCRKKLEIFQSMTDKPLRKCPKCERNRLKRIIGTGAGIIFKGNGFYCTDYRSENYKNASAKEKKSEKSTTTKKEGSSKTSSSDKKTAVAAKS